ncbi:MAG: transglycosylase domain-containing protein [Pseudomonadota bacterium]
MAFNPRQIIGALKTAVKTALLIFAAYLLVLTGVVLWAFEVKFQRWPTYIYGAPSSVRVGDDIVKTRLFDRLRRLGYIKGPTMVAEPGQWSRSGTGLDLHLKYCPIAGRGIATGPVSFSLDLDTIRSIRLVRSHQDVDKIVLEPELLGVLPADGTVPMLCRPLPLDRMKGLLVDAVVLTEDRRFFSHHGVDPGSMFRALKANVKARRYVQGASTITQQLVKMTLLTPRKTLFRKTNEIFLALIADALYSKRVILQAYLNRVYFGHWGQFPVYGAAEASRNFFGKDFDRLNPEECAFLAATIMAPNVITPLRHAERALGRRNMILGLLFKEGKIGRDEYDQARAAPLRVRKPGPPPVKAAAFEDLVGEEMDDAETVGSGKIGYVVTSLDPLIQNDANMEVRHLGGGTGDTHLAVLDLPAGEIKALVAPGPDGWDGKGANLESVLPMATVAALIPDGSGSSKFTLTSRLFSSVPGGRPITLKEAFAGSRPLLIKRLVDSIGQERIVRVLEEFEIPAKTGAGGSIVVAPVSPLRMARSYAMLASLGWKRSYGVGIKDQTVAAVPSQSEETRSLLTEAPLFLIGCLLKDLPPLEDMNYGLDEVRQRPSVFVSQDDTGIWGVAYRPDTFLLVRVPGRDVHPDLIEKMMLRLLPPPGRSAGNLPAVPSGVVFRKICVDSGLRATSICPHVILVPFLKGSQPKEWCPLLHRPKAVRSDRNMKAQEP